MALGGVQLTCINAHCALLIVKGQMDILLADSRQLSTQYILVAFLTHIHH